MQLMLCGFVVLHLIVFWRPIKAHQWNDLTTNLLETNSSRVIINASNEIVHPHPNVKPTSASVEHKPGVPPMAGGSSQAFIPTSPASPARPTRPQKPTKPTNAPPQQPDNPFNWLVEWFEKIKGSRTPNTLNSSELGSFYLESLNVSQTAQLYELLNHSRYNQSSEFAQMLSTNKGLVDWFLQVIGIAKPDVDPGQINPISGKVCPSCSCGETFKQVRIVGGMETLTNAYPWMGYLRYNGRFYCGCSVINNFYVLTAAHCINGFNKDRLDITFLDHDRSTPLDTQTITVKVANILKHSRYNNGANYNNDIALIKVDKELDFSGRLRPVCLPTAKRSFTGYTGRVVGWGATEEHGAISNKLREVDVPILANAHCLKSGYGSRITDNMLCAGYADGKKDSCQGDSGGPLHVQNHSIFEIVGIVSWGEGCAEANYPGVYTRVNRYLSWINANTMDACYCT